MGKNFGNKGSICLKLSPEPACIYYNEMLEHLTNAFLRDQ